MSKALDVHENWHGKWELKSKVDFSQKDILAVAYTPGVAEPCKEIHKNKDEVYRYTRKWNTVAVVTDGTAVLGLGDIGPEAGLPVMEGKAILFKEFADVDAIPICLDTKDSDEIVKTVQYLAPTFGGINLEDIASPRCFEIEKKLKETLDIPVFHDDQHGTAVVVLAALINALKVVGKKIEEVNCVLNGPGAAGIAITKLLLGMGIGNVVLCDRSGALYKGLEGMNAAQEAMTHLTNINDERGTLAEVIRGKDVFIGVSAPNALTAEMVEKMAEGAIVLALANPTPEIFPDEAKKGGAKVVGTGRSDFPNQVNNVLAFPGIFRGTLDVRAKDITEGMKIAAAKAIASLVCDEELNEENILPSAIDRRVAKAVAEAVAEAAKADGVARI